MPLAYSRNIANRCCPIIIQSVAHLQYKNITSTLSPSPKLLKYVNVTTKNDHDFIKMIAISNSFDIIGKSIK